MYKKAAAKELQEHKKSHKREPEMNGNKGLLKKEKTVPKRGPRETIESSRSAHLIESALFRNRQFHVFHNSV